MILVEVGLRDQAVHLITTDHLVHHIIEVPFLADLEVHRTIQVVQIQEHIVLQPDLLLHRTIAHQVVVLQEEE